MKYFDWLAGGFSPTHLKKYARKIGSSSPGRDKHKTCLSCHHLVELFGQRMVEEWSTCANVPLDGPSVIGIHIWSLSKLSMKVRITKTMVGQFRLSEQKNRLETCGMNRLPSNNIVWLNIEHTWSLNLNRNYDRMYSISFWKIVRSFLKYMWLLLPNTDT